MSIFKFEWKVRDVLSLMHSCGMYDYSGQFAFTVRSVALSFWDLLKKNKKKYYSLKSICLGWSSC